MVNPLAHSIPLRATDYVYVSTHIEDREPTAAEIERVKGQLREIAANAHREIVGDIVLGPGWLPGELYAFAYTRATPEAAEAVRAHVEASQGVSGD